MNEQMKRSVDMLATCKSTLEQGNLSEEEFKQFMIDMVTSVGQAFEQIGQAFAQVQSSMQTHEGKTAETAMQINAMTARANDAVQQL